jgi:IS5 family transposase
VHAADLLLRQWFNLSDPAVEESLYDSAGMRQFVGVDLGCAPVPELLRTLTALEAPRLFEML